MRLSGANFRLSDAPPARRGAALVMALLAAFSVAAISIAALQLASVTTRRQSAAADRTRAFYLAEAGLAEAYWGVMTGKTGQVASSSDPAAYGDGLFWVDSEYQLDGSVSLEATGMCGRSRARLGLAVRWTEAGVATLGFFSGGDLILQPGSMVDGYASADGSYEEQATSAQGGRLSTRTGGRVGANGNVTVQSTGLRGAGDIPVGYGRGGLGRDPWGNLDPGATPAGRPLDRQDRIYRDTAFFVSRGLQRQQAGLGTQSQQSGGTRTFLQRQQAQSQKIGDANAARGGGAVVYGDVSHGAEGQLTVQPGSYLEGQVRKLSSPTKLPPVELPSLEIGGAVNHEDPLPLILSAASASYESLSVSRGSQVVVVGPTTLVVGSLQLEDGAEFVFDTTEGDIVLYVVDGLEFETGSLVTFTEERPGGLEVLVAGERDVLLGSSDPFHGLLYAPSATVRLGADGEFFGALVAGDVELGSRARLHFDRSLADAQDDTAPLLRGWEIIELGVIRGQADPFAALGVDRNALRKPVDAHTDLWIEIKYTNAAGVELEFEGWESAFDWGNVSALDTMRARLTPDGDEIERVSRKGPWLESKLK